MEHDERADQLERELGDMERQSERLGEDIEGAREDWEHKKRDPSVPGATEADEGTGEDSDPQPEPEESK